MLAVSDVHGGPLVGAVEVAEFVAQLNALDADIEVLVGDIADGPPADRGDDMAPCATPSPPTTTHTTLRS